MFVLLQRLYSVVSSAYDAESHFIYIADYKTFPDIISSQSDGFSIIPPYGDFGQDLDSCNELWGICITCTSCIIWLCSGTRYNKLLE